MDLGINHQYKKGEKQLLVLDFVASKGKEGCTRGEISKFAYELTHGRGSFDRKKNSGYWSSIFLGSYIGFFGTRIPREPGWGYVCFSQNSNGNYIINDAGFEKIDELMNKFNFKFYL